MEKSTSRVRRFSNPVAAIDKTTQQKISKDIKEMNNTNNQQDLTDIHRTPYLIAEYTLFVSTRGTFTKKDDDILSHRTNLNKFKRITILAIMFADHNKIKLEINSKKITGNSPNTWKVNNTLLNSPWVK